MDAIEIDDTPLSHAYQELIAAEEALQEAAKRRETAFRAFGLVARAAFEEQRAIRLGHRTTG